MNKSILTILFGIIFMLNSCNNSKVTSQNGTAMNDFEILYQSEYGGNGVEETNIIENQGEFAALWAQVTHQSAMSAPKVDFSKKIIIVKHFQSRNSGGTEYKIESVSNKENTIEVQYSVSGPSEMATMAITNPLLMLAIDKVSNPKVEFIIQNKN